MIDFDDFDEPGWLVTALGILLVVVTAPLWLAVIGYEKARERYDSRGVRRAEPANQDICGR